MNHIAGTTSNSRGICDNMPASHPLPSSSSCVSAQVLTGISPTSTPQNPIMKPGVGQLFDAPFRGSIRLQHALYKVRGLAAETGWGDVTARGISPNPSRLGCLIYSTLAKVIPYCYLWPTSMFNVCLWSNIWHWTRLWCHYMQDDITQLPRCHTFHSTLVCLHCQRTIWETCYLHFLTLFMLLDKYMFVTAGEVDSDTLDHADTVQVKSGRRKAWDSKNNTTIKRWIKKMNVFAFIFHRGQ